MNESIEIKRNKFSLVTKQRRFNNNTSFNLIQQKEEDIFTSKAKMSLKFNDFSIISTAEEHIQPKLTSQINLKSKRLNPKLTSSRYTLLDRFTNNKKNKDEQSITFNVDFASTPKKLIQRSSTPKRILKPKIITITSSSTTTTTATNTKRAKIIPPPLLTSSFRSIKDQKPKRKVTSSCHTCNKQKSKRAKLMCPVKFKFPIKYLNSKTIDIDRINFNYETTQSSTNFESVHFSGQQQSNYNLFGDYKLWII